MKKLLVVLACIALAMTAAACGGGDENDGNDQAPQTSDQVTIVFSSVDVEDSACGQCMTEFKNYVEDASDGAINVELYFNGVLGGDRDNAEGVLLNTIQMSLVQSDVMTNWVPEFNALYFPYMFSGYDEWFDAMDNKFFDLLAAASRAEGIVYLGFSEAGARYLWNNVREIHSPADAKGISLRVPEAEISIAFAEDIGCSATPVSFTEVYTSLQNGVVDGIENPVELVYTSHFNEVLKYMTKDYHFFTPLALITSVEFYDALTPEQQQIIAEGAAVLQESNRKILAEHESEFEAAIDAGGVTITELTEDEMKQFQDATADIINKFSGKCSPEIMEIVNSYL